MHTIFLNEENIKNEDASFVDQLLHVSYNAVKVVEYKQGMKTHFVHRGTHSCSLKPAVIQNDDFITKTIQENADLGTNWNC